MGLLQCLPLLRFGPQLLLSLGQLLSPLLQLAFQFRSALVQLARSNLGLLPLFGLFRQPLTQTLNLLFGLRPGPLQFLDSALEFALLGGGVIRLRLELFLRLLELLLQPRACLQGRGQFGLQLLLAGLQFLRPLLGGLPPPAFRRERFDQRLYLFLQRRLLGLELADSGQQGGVLGARVVLLRPLLLELFLQLLLQPAELGLQFVPALTQFPCLLLGAFAALGFLSQGLGQAPELLCCLHLRRFQLVGSRREPGLLRSCSLLPFFQFLPQAGQLRLDFAPLLPKLRSLLLRAFAASGFLTQRFRQALELLFHLRFGRFQRFRLLFQPKPFRT